MGNVGQEDWSKLLDVADLTPTERLEAMALFEAQIGKGGAVAEKEPPKPPPSSGIRITCGRPRVVVGQGHRKLQVTGSAMKKLALALVVLCLADALFAAEPAASQPTSQPASRKTLFLSGLTGKPQTTQPTEKDPARHKEFLAGIKNMGGDIKLVFVGDSITHGWRTVGEPVWQKYFAPYKALNLGVDADRTQHVLWRLKNGELDGYAASLFVITIGVNNSQDPALDVAAGIEAIVKEIENKQPQARILLMGILPQSPKPSPWRRHNDEISRLIAKLDDGRKLKYLDIGDKFLNADKTISKDVMPDFLHPSLKGYEIWAQAIAETVKQMLEGD